MPTLRLGDQEKSDIKEAFHTATTKAKNNKPFPLTEADFPEFGYTLLSDETRLHYQWLRENNEDLTKVVSWGPEVNLKNADALYEIALHSGVSMPKDNLVVPETHPKYLEILEWAQFYCKTATRVRISNEYLSEIVNECCSTGQIRTVLRPEIMVFLPEHMMSSFGNAERKSRWPRGLATEGAKEKLIELADVLALGALSPNKREGLNVTATRNAI